MIKFFKNIRRGLIQDNRFTKYLLYAIGEIVLVMIGILLAFQVNSWKDRQTRAAKEISYLKEIRSNLLDDKRNLDSVVAFNEYKAKVTDSMFSALEMYSNPEQYMPIIIPYMYTLTEYEIFEPNRIAFNNMLAAENIDLITNDNLKKHLSQHYKKELDRTAQENVKQRSRQFGDYVAVVSFNRETMKVIIGHDSQLKSISEVTLHKDPKVYAYLFSMLMSTESQTNILIQTKKETNALIALIDQQINQL